MKKDTMMTLKGFTVTVLLILKIDISICYNNISTDSPNLLGNDLNILNQTLLLAPELYTCSKHLTDSEDFFTNCDNDEKVPGSSDISDKACWVAPSHLMSKNISSKFRLLVKDLPKSCKANSFIVHLPLIRDIEGLEGKLLQNGYLTKWIDNKQEYYHPDEFCINSQNKTFLEIKICKPNCDDENGRTCIKKCCALDKVFSFGFSPNPDQNPHLVRGCQFPEHEIFKPTVYYNSRERISEEELSNMPGIHYTEKYPRSFKYNCENNKTLFFSSPYVVENIKNLTNQDFNHLKFRIRKDGKILYRGNDGTCEVLDPKIHDFCIDGVVSFDIESLSYRNSEDTLLISLCALPRSEVMDPSLVYGSMMLFSCIFLILTIIVYALLWDRQTVHGWTIVTHIVCLCFMYVFVGTGHLVRYNYGASVHHTKGCIFVGIAAHFFTLATFSWLATISFDLFFTFRAITPRSGNRSKGWSRYIKYSILGWGIPIMIISTGLIIDGKRTDDDCLEMLSPGYGYESCYLQEKALGLYMYLPLGILLICNLLFFGITSTRLYQFRESTKMATKDDTQQQFYRLFVKLFFVMGISWKFEVISWAVSGIVVRWYWVIFDVINILRAIAVFFIFVCKPDIIKSLEQKYPRLRPILVPCKRIFWKGRRSHKDHNTTDESIGLNSSIRTTKSSILRMSDVEH